MWPRRRLLVVLAAAGAAAVLGGPGRVPPPRRLWQGRAFGAEARLVLVGDPEQTAAALAAARLAIEAAERRWSLFRPDSDLVRLNRDGRLPEADGPWRELLALSDRLHAATGGLFDPSIQPLWLAQAQGAAAGRIEAARAAVGWTRLTLPAPGVRALRLGAGQALTFNGIAQGWATDALRGSLAAAGLGQALVSAGETAALGGPWRLGLAAPGSAPFARIAVRDTALAVSAPGALRLAGAAPHILAPDGRAPLWTAAAVEAETAALADGLATALPLMTAAEAAAAARALGGIRRIWLVETGGTALCLEGRRLGA